MLSDAANWATVIGAIPVFLAAVVFLFRTLPGLVRAPKGLRIDLRRAVGALGYFVQVTNYGEVERYIHSMGVMPAKMRPRLTWLCRRVPACMNSEDSLRTSTLMVLVGTGIDRGRRVSRQVPQPIDPESDGEPLQWAPDHYKAAVKQYESWENAPGKPIPLVAYVRLDDGSIILSRKIRLKPDQQCLAMIPLCKCGHSITEHSVRQLERLATNMHVSANCQSCKCKKYREGRLP